VLHPANVARTNKLAVRVENCRADGNTTFRQSHAGFSERDGEHSGVVEAQLRILRTIMTFVPHSAGARISS